MKRSLVIMTVALAILLAVACNPVASNGNMYWNILPKDTVAVFALPNIDQLKDMEKQPLFKYLVANYNQSPDDNPFSEFLNDFKKNIGMEFEEFVDGLSGNLSIALIDIDMKMGIPEIAVMAEFAGGDKAVNEFI